jgi:VWFA-related protein
MRLARAFALLATCVPAALAAPPAPPAAPQTFGEVVEVNVVNVDVYATGKAGNRVTGLRKGDFEVLEDGKPVEVTNFEALEGGRTVQASPPPAKEAEPAAPGDSGAAVAANTAEDAWNLVVFFDNTHLRAAGRARVLDQLRGFLDRQLAPGDRVMIVTYERGLHVRRSFSADRAAIATALQGLEGTMASGPKNELGRRQAFEEIMAIQEDSLKAPPHVPCPTNIAAPAHAYASARRQEVRRSLDALTLLVNSLSGVPGSKAVLHVSDGLPLTPGEEVFQFLVEICGGGASSGVGRTTMAEGQTTEPYDPLSTYDSRESGGLAYQAASQAPLDAKEYAVAKELQALVDHANAHRVTLYTLQAGLQGPDALDAGTAGPYERMFQFASLGSVLRANNRESLQFLADGTGGRPILDTNDFLPDLSRMREDFESHYSLGYAAAHNGDGREHKIEVRVKRPGVRLRYRQSYRDKPALEKTVDRMLAGLFYGMEENPLEISLEIGEQSAGPSGTVTVPMRLKIPLFKLAILNRDEAFQGSLRLFVATRDKDGGTSPVRQVAVLLQIPRKEVLRAMGQFYVYNLTLQLQPGEQQVAVAVRDEIAATTSYLARGVKVAPVNTTAVKP